MPARLSQLARCTDRWRHNLVVSLSDDDSVAHWKKLIKAGAAKVPSSWARLSAETQARRLIKAERDRIADIGNAVWAFDVSATAAVVEVARGAVDLPVTPEVLPTASGLISFESPLVDDANLVAIVAVTWGPADTEWGSGTQFTVWCIDDQGETLTAAYASLHRFMPVWTEDQAAAANTLNPRVVVNRAIIAAWASIHTALSIHDVEVNDSVVRTATASEVSQAVAMIAETLPSVPGATDGTCTDRQAVSKRLAIGHDPLFDAGLDTKLSGPDRWVPQRHRDVTDRIASLVASIEDSYPHIFAMVGEIRRTCVADPDQIVAREVARVLLHHYRANWDDIPRHAIVVTGVDTWLREGRHVVHIPALDYQAANTINPATTRCPTGPHTTQPGGLVLTTPARDADLLVYFHQFSAGLNLLHVDIPHHPSPSLQISGSLTRGLLLGSGTIAQTTASDSPNGSQEDIADVASYNAHTANLLATITAPEARVHEAGYLLGRRPRCVWPATPTDQSDTTPTLWILDS